MQFKINQNEKLLSRINYEKKLFKKSFPINLLNLLFSRIRLIFKSFLSFIIKRL